MSNLLRVNCNCGNTLNAVPGEICPKCKQPILIPEDGMISLYRMGSPLGIASGFSIYINGQPMGHIANTETVHIPLPYGTYNVHIACGMNRKCKDMEVTLTPENRSAFAKVRMKMGFWTNSFIIEPCNEGDIPK